MARVTSATGPFEVRAFAVKDPIAGAGLTLDGAGGHEPKGVADRWRIDRVAS